LARWGVAVVVGWMATTTLALAQTRIESVTASVQGGSEVVRIDLNQPLAAPPSGFATRAPANIALDFPGVTNGTGESSIPVNQGNVRSAKIAQVSGLTRVVLSLNRSTTYRTELRGKSVLVTLAPAIAESVPAPAQVAFAQNQNEDTLPLRDIDFKRGVENAGRVIVGLANNQVGVDIQQHGQSLVVEFLKTSLPEGLRRRLDVSDFGTPVQTVSTTQARDRVRMVIDMAGPWEYSAYQSDNQLVVEVRHQKTDPNKLTQGPGYHGEKLSLNFQNIDVRSLLQVIADFTNFNIVTSDSVQGNLTLRLKDVPWDQALDIILQAKNLGMKRVGNVLQIAPKDEMAAKEKADLEAQASIRDLEPLQTESFQLNYTKATEIKNQLSNSGTGGGGGGTSGTTGSMLSSRGSVIAEPRTNQLFITDIPSRLDKIRQMIAKLDVPVRQVLIEARIVEATDNFGRSLGARLGGRLGNQAPGVTTSGGYAAGGAYDAISPVTGGSTSAAASALNSAFVNLPADTSTIAPGVNPGNFAVTLFNSAANHFLSLELSALEADGRGRIVSSPRVVTADQTKAIIEQGTEIPYQQATSSGATAVTFRKAVLSLEVTPQITPEGNIILDLTVNKDSPGQTVEGGVSINTKRVQTQVLVENGGTVVIGGIYELSESDSVNKVPLLGDIPVLGNLFKQTTKQSNKQELLIFITPKVVSERTAMR
jgi:type IV pilus assembly protein PilQ